LQAIKIKIKLNKVMNTTIVLILILKKILNKIKKTMKLIKSNKIIIITIICHYHLLKKKIKNRNNKTLENMNIMKEKENIQEQGML